MNKVSYMIGWVGFTLASQNAAGLASALSFAILSLVFAYCYLDGGGAK